MNSIKIYTPSEILTLYFHSFFDLKLKMSVCVNTIYPSKERRYTPSETLTPISLPLFILNRSGVISPNFLYFRSLISTEVEHMHS